MKLDPIQDTLLVLPDTHATRTAEGLVIPDTVRRATVTGVVISVGPGMPRRVGGPVIPLDIIPGDRVLFQKHMGTETVSEEQKVLLLRYPNVLAVIALDTQVEWVDPPPPPIPEELQEAAPMDFGA